MHQDPGWLHPLLVECMAEVCLASASTTRGPGQAEEEGGGQGSKSHPFCGFAQEAMVDQ